MLILQVAYIRYKQSKVKLTKHHHHAEKGKVIGGGTKGPAIQKTCNTEHCKVRFVRMSNLSVSYAC